MLSQLSALNQKLGKLADIDAGLKPVLEVLEPARIQLQEAVYALNDYLSRVELDPERLREVEARLDGDAFDGAQIPRRRRKSCRRNWRSLSAQLRQLADVSDLDALRAQETKLRADYLALAQKLSKARAKAAAALGDAVTAAMQELSMAGGRFAVALESVRAGQLRRSSKSSSWSPAMPAWRRGRWPRSLAAANWRASRWRFRSSPRPAAPTAQRPTLIFDEVDSGIGGGVAEVVGRLLKKLGQERQVLCVTHLPQVASQANQHFQVSKSSDAGKTVSRIDACWTARRASRKSRACWAGWKSPPPPASTRANCWRYKYGRAAAFWAMAAPAIFGAPAAVLAPRPGPLFRPESHALS